MTNVKENCWMTLASVLKTSMLTIASDTTTAPGSPNARAGNARADIHFSRRLISTNFLFRAHTKSTPATKTQPSLGVLRSTTSHAPRVKAVKCSRLISPNASLPTSPTVWSTTWSIHMLNTLSVWNVGIGISCPTIHALTHARVHSSSCGVPIHACPRTSAIADCKTWPNPVDPSGALRAIMGITSWRRITPALPSWTTAGLQITVMHLHPTHNARNV